MFTNLFSIPIKRWGLQKPLVMPQEEVPLRTISVEFESFAGQVAYHSIIVDSAFPELRNIELCIEQLRFIPRSESFENTRIDFSQFNIGCTPLLTGGTVLGELKLPALTYKRVEVDLYPECANRASLSFKRGSTLYQTTDRITIGYVCEFVPRENQILKLPLKQLLQQMSTYDESIQLKDSIEGLTGVWIEET